MVFYNDNLFNNKTMRGRPSPKAGIKIPGDVSQMCKDEFLKRSTKANIVIKAYRSMISSYDYHFKKNLEEIEVKKFIFIFEEEKNLRK